MADIKGKGVRDLLDPSNYIDLARFIEAYFQYHGIMEEARLQVTDFYMSKEALSWIRGMKKNGLLTTWNKFVEDLRERFGPSTFEDKLEQLF